MKNELKKIIKDNLPMQNLTVTTVIKLDTIDLIKCLFGRCIKVETTLSIPSYVSEIKSYDANSKTTIEKTSSHFIKQNLPNIGWEPKWIK